LLLVDLQNRVLSSVYHRNEIVSNIVRLIGKARNSSMPIVWVQHTDSDIPAGTHAWEIVPEVIPEPGDIKMQKRYNSCFEQTGLNALLSKLEVGRVVLAGAATNWCIRSTAFAALERSYNVCLISDAHTTEDVDLNGGRRIQAQDLIDDLNNAMAWLSYPGRLNESKSTEQFLQEK
jgi:nicotinamidase-related amidase